MKYRIVFILSVMFLTSFLLQASSFEGSKEVIINEPVDGDLYVAGSTVKISALVSGDLVCGGGHIVVSDSVAEDIIVAGGEISLNSGVGDDVRAAGGKIEISANVHGDLIVVGGSVHLHPSVIVFGNIHMYGGDMMMEGIVKGTTKIHAAEVEWIGHATNKLTIKAENLVFAGQAAGTTELAARHLEVKGTAGLEGTTTYWCENGEINFGDVLAPGATANFDPGLSFASNDFRWRFLGFSFVVFLFYRLLAMGLVIGVLIYFFDSFFKHVVEVTNSAYIHQIGYGFLYLLGVPLLICLTFVTIVGIPIGIMMMTLFGITVGLGHSLAAVLIAYSYDYHYQKELNRWQLFWSATLSFIALKAISWIPIVGWIISLLVVVIALGSIVQVWWKNRTQIDSVV